MSLRAANGFLRWVFGPVPLALPLSVAFSTSAQPILIESRTVTNTDNVPYWSYPSGTWGTSGNQSKVPSTPRFVATGSRQTVSAAGPPSFRVHPTNALSLQPGVRYAVQTTTPAGSSQPPPDDLVVGIAFTDVTNSTLPETTMAFSTAGVDKWTTLGFIIPSSPNPTFTFTYVSGSIGSSPTRRFYAQCLRFVPQTQTSATRVWTGGAGSSDLMWNNPTNWDIGAPLFSGDDIQLTGSGGYSIPDGPFAVNSLTFLNGSFSLGTNFSGPLTFLTTNGMANLSSSDQLVLSAIAQSGVPLYIHTGERTLQFSNFVSGDAGYVVNGSGTLYLRTPGSATNPITGPILVNTGATLRLARHGTLGDTGPDAGDLTLDGATLRNDDTSSGAPLISANRGIVIGPGGATLLLPTSSQNLFFDGSITNGDGNGQLIKTGSGKLTFGGDEPNSFSGATIVNAGRLFLGKTSSNAISGDLTVASIVQLTASDQIADTATVTVAGGLLGFSPGVFDTVSNVILDSGSITGAFATVSAANFDFRSGTNTANLVGENFVKSTTGTVWLGGDNSFTGTTTVSNGQLLVIGNIVAGDVTVSGGTLGGNGAIGGTVEIQSGATLSPGISIGTLTVNNSLLLQSGSKTFIELNRFAGTSDLVAGIASVSYGGTLFVTNLAGLLQTNDAFKIFDAQSYDGTFEAFSLPALDNGLVWDTGGLTNDGTIKIIPPPAPSEQPAIVSTMISGTDMILSGGGGTSNATFYVLSATNIALPLINWTSIGTNQFDESGNFSVTNPYNPAAPQRYFLIQIP